MEQDSYASIISKFQNLQMMLENKHVQNLKKNLMVLICTTFFVLKQPLLS